MAVALEFIDLIIRIDAIEARYEGGWEQFKKDHEAAIGSVAWYDDHLFRTGAMSPDDIGPWIEAYREKGLQLWREEGGKPVEWIDGCVNEFSGPTLPCEWIDYTAQRAAYLKQNPAGKVIGRSDFPSLD